MGKWDKVVDQLEEEDALTKAPEYQDLVVDLIDPQDETMPPEFRGCQVIERQHPGGQAEVFYCRPDGATYTEDQANAAIAAFRSGGVPAGGGVPGAVVAPPAAESLIDTLGVSLDIPPKLRGARLVDRGGSFVFITQEGDEIPKEVGDGLFDAWESPEVTNPNLRLTEAELAEPVPVPVPTAGPATPAETVIDTLGTGNDVPPQLRGARLVDRAGSFFFVTPSGDAIPKEVGDALFETWEEPEQPAEQPAAVSTAGPEQAPPEAVASPEPAPTSEPSADAPAIAAAAPAAADPVTVIEELGTGDDVPPQLRGAKLVERAGVFVYATADGNEMPAEIGEELLHAWQPALSTPEPEPEAEQQPEPGPEAAEPVAPEAEKAPEEQSADLRKPFGYDDFGPVTVPDAQVPETIDVQQRQAAILAAALAESAAEGEPSPAPEATAEAPPTDAATATEAPPEPAPQADAEPAPEPAPQQPAATAPEPRTEALPGGKLEEQLRDAAETVRRAAASGEIDVGAATPTPEQMEALVLETVAAEPADEAVARMLRRSQQLADQIEQHWTDDAPREQREIGRDLQSGTLIVAAVNTTQLGNLDVLGLLTLLRLRRSGEDRAVGELARTLCTRLTDQLARTIKAASFTDQVTAKARSSSTVVSDGRLLPEGVKGLVAQIILDQVGLTVGEVADAFREKGFAVPGLARLLLKTYRPFADDLGERVAQACG